MATGNFRESEHPRDEFGRFTEKNYRINSSYSDIINDSKGQEIADFVESVKNGNPIAKKIVISEVTDRERKRIEELTGEKLTATKHTISINEVKHIIKRHGEKGLADKSMADIEAYKAIPDIINNFDNIEYCYDKKGEIDVTYAYRDKNREPAKLIKYTKYMSDKIAFIVEALSDNKKDELNIITAYCNKKKSK